MNFLFLETLATISNPGIFSNLFSTGTILKVLGPFVLILLIYIYFSSALMHISRKLKVNQIWEGLAWLFPLYLVNVLAGFSWGFLFGAILVLGGGSILASILYASAAFSLGSITFPLILIVFLSILSSLLLIVWNWRIAVNLDRPGWWALISPIGVLVGFLFAFASPIIGLIIEFLSGIWLFVMWGIFAWSAD